MVIHGLEKEWGEEVTASLGQKNAVLHIEDITAEGASPAAC